MKPRAAIYARVSTDDVDQATSIPNQIEMCQREAERRGLELVAVHQDTKSGGNMDRPGWKHIEALIVNNEIQVLVVKARSRIVRDELTWKLIERDLFQKYGTQLVVLMGVEQSEDPTSILAVGVEVLFDAHYRRQLKYNTMRAMRQLLERGMWRARIPYGCMKGQIPGIPVKDPDAWTTVERVFNMAARGHSVVSICEHLRVTGLLAPGGNEWGSTSIRRLISSTFYAGYIVHAGKRYELKHDCRIDCWEEAQKCFAVPSRSNRSEHVYLLPRVCTDLWEVTAPASLAGQPVPLHGKFVYGRGRVRHDYYCRADRTRDFGGIKSRPISEAVVNMRSTVRADELETAVVEALIKNIDLLPESVKTIPAQTEDIEALQFRQRQLRTLIGKRRTQLSQSKLALADAFVASRRVAEAVEERIELVTVELEHFEAEAEEVSSRIDKARHLAAMGARKVNLIKLLWVSGEREHLRRILDVLLEKVVVRLDEVLIYMAIPPVCGRRQKSALTGIEPVFSP